MATNAEKQLSQLRAELDAVKQEFSEFRQAVENTFSAVSGLGLGIEFSRQLSLLKKKNAPETTPEVAPPLPSTGPTVEEVAAVKAAITKMIAEARATLPLPSLDQALKTPPQSVPVVEETKTLNEVLSLDDVAKLELTF